MQNVLLIFPSVISKTKKGKLIENIFRKLLSKRIVIISLKNEDNYIVLDVSDLAVARSALIGMFGIEKVAIARRTYNDFSNVVNAISAVGREIIMPNEKFVVKVQLYTTGLKLVDYKERDIEFASTGQLVSELSARGARPARSKDIVDRIIQSYIDKNYAYVCLETSPSVGGMPFDSQHHTVLCSMHSWLSVLSCIASMRSGFRPEIFLPYLNEDDLRNKLKLSKSVINMIDKKRYRVSIAHVVPPSSLKGSTEVLVLESIYYKMLSLLPGDVVLVSLSAVIFPTWYVNSVIGDLISAGKIPWTPLVFKSSEMKDDNSEPNISDESRPLRTTSNQGSYDKHRQMISDVASCATTTLKTISFKIGSNYIHDIIDAV